MENEQIISELRGDLLSMKKEIIQIKKEIKEMKIKSENNEFDPRLLSDYSR